MARTHEVLNQPPPYPEVNAYTSDPILPEAVAREGAGWAGDLLTEFGGYAGSAEMAEWGFQANENPPVLHTHDRSGNRIDRVEFHPAWHRLMERSVAAGVHSLAHESDQTGRHVARAGLMYLDSRVEQGHGCPISMTASVTAVLHTHPEVPDLWSKGVTSRVYDPTFTSPEGKPGLLMGMGMTEKQGGSDVRTNTTRAEPVEDVGLGQGYRITGHKWFTSAPMCDGFLILAQAPGGLSCFLLPRWTRDREVNAFEIQRLKDKLGNRSNASSEVEFTDAWAMLVGDEGRGVATIIEMVNGTRLDCIIGSAAIMREAVAQAAHHVHHRTAFGGLLEDKPLMRNVVADLEVEAEAATLMMMRLAGAFDRAEDDPAEAAIKRILTPVTKYWVTKRCTGLVREAMECLGGNAYVEDSIMPRLFRESPLNAIWEGSGNVIALDMVRVMSREPEAIDLLIAELDEAQGANRRLDDHLDRLKASLADLSDPEWEARRLVEQIAVAVAAALVTRYGSDQLADAYCGTRLGGDGGHLYGTLPVGVEVDSLMEATSAVES